MFDLEGEPDLSRRSLICKRQRAADARRISIGNCQIGFELVPFHLTGETIELNFEFPGVEPACVLTNNVAHEQLPVTRSGLADECCQRCVRTRIKRLLEVVLIATLAIMNQSSVARWAYQLDLKIANERVRDADTGSNPTRESCLIERRLARDAGGIVVRNGECRCDLECNNLAHNFRPDTEIDYRSRRGDLRQDQTRVDIVPLPRRRRRRMRQRCSANCSKQVASVSTITVVFKVQAPIGLQQRALIVTR